ncbi:HIRAN domain-containing protein [Rhizobium sp.]|uniref:HIRAN domain-containing protein n=1 Tax=Rhizobium sp. TaxID=391 RepID=UPI000E878EE2|nr:hypothetical protein [Rhizobium sp.]
MNFDNLDYLYEDVKVFGCKHHIENCDKFYAAAKEWAEWGLIEDNIFTKLKKEPKNKHDPYAIQVIGEWRDQDENKFKGVIGYLPKQIAYALGQNLDEKDKIYAEFVSIGPHDEFGYDIIVNILVKYSDF